MASPRHQRLARLLSEQPQAIIVLLEHALGLLVPGELEVLQGPESVREGGSQDYLADGTILLRAKAGSGRSILIVIDIQLGNDPTKARRWPLYVAGAHNRLDADTILVVITDSRRVAKWATRPIGLGLGCLVLRPF